MIKTLARWALNLEDRLRHSQRQGCEPVLILAYMPALGYAVHMTPVYEALHRKLSPTIVATHGDNAELLRHCAHIDYLLVTPDPMRDLPGAVISLRRQLKGLGLSPQVVLTGPQDARTKIGLLGALACAGLRGGFAVHPWIYRKPLTYDKTLSRVANNLRLAELLGCDTAGCVPRVFFSAAQADVARNLLPAAPVLAVVACNSGGHPTAWHDERWAQVIRHAHEQLGYEVVYLGTARDEPGIERIQALAGGLGTSLAGRTSLGELAATLAQCDLCVSLMTGTLHVARAVGTPVVALGLAWEPPLEWVSPPEPHVRLLRGPNAPRMEDYRCDDLSAEHVIAAITEMVAHFPASAEARQKRVTRSLVFIP